MNPGVHRFASLTTAELVVRLTELAKDEPSVLAFDGDGTLWEGDVSDDVYFAACDEAWFLEDARAAMVRALNSQGCGTAGTLSELCRRLHAEQLRGAVPEQLLFECMTYCYAGRSTAELTAFAAKVLHQKRIAERIRQGLATVISWARRVGHRCYLVSASPRPIVDVPASLLGFEADEIIAGSATNSSPGRICDHITHPLPYRAEKLLQLRKRIGNRRLLAAFGDSPFDAELLTAAELPVAVGGKSALLAELADNDVRGAVRWNSDA